MNRTLSLTLAALLSLPALAQQSVPEDDEQMGTFLFAPQPVHTVEDHGPPRLDGKRQMHPGIRRASYAALETPDVRRFQVNDLVMIIIRESFSNASEQTTEIEKDGKVSANISKLPDLRASDLINLQMRMNALDTQPGLDADFSREFTGEGDTSRTDTMTGRVMARVVDVKPNATLVLEARDHIQADEEIVTIVVSGTVRAQDITERNTVESDQIYGLHIRKEHEGKLRDTNEKGWLTRAFDAIFDF